MPDAIPFDRSWKVEKSRYRDHIKAEFEHRCAYCNQKTEDLTLDHVQAHCQGGGDAPSNLIPACRRCNGSKGSRALLDWYTAELSYFCPERLHRILDRCGNPQPISRRTRGRGFG